MDLESVRTSFERAASFMRAGDARTAEQICRNALEEFPRDGNLLCLLGAALARQRRVDEARAVLDRTVQMFPEFARAHEELGATLLLEGQFEQAAASLRRAIELEPQAANAHHKLGRALSALGRNDEADEAYERSFRLTPNRAELARAAELHRRGQYREAERIYRAVLRKDPRNVDALRLLAQIAVRMKQWGDAEALLTRAVEIAPDFAGLWNDLVQVYQEQDKYQEALAVLDRVLAVDPTRAHFHCHRGNVLSMAGRHRDSIAAYRRALELQPGHAGSLAGLGHVLKTIGRREEAIGAYRDCVRRHPELGDVWWSLANLKTFQFDDADLESMRSQLRSEKLGDEPRANFCFALGKGCEDRGDHAAAFEYYTQGNAFRRRHEHYDPVQTEVIHDRLIEVFTPELLAAKVSHEALETVPIFIVGLPRSGSTLIEQILASHSRVEGTHELPELNRVVRAINEDRRDRITYPEALRDMAPEDLGRCGRDYLARTCKYRRGAPCFTDKMPNNFAHVGLIHLAMPNAKIIDARRHPLDSCLGCFKQLFARGQPFTYDLLELGEYYLQYRRMMDFWDERLPGRVLEVDYEALVADQEGETRRLLEFCGLPWEDACLRFYETVRAVRTASSEQVRLPIYADSLHLWRRYEKHLGPLIEVLQPVLAELPAEQRPAGL